MNLQKQSEWGFLNEFTSRWPDFPRGELIESEAPDFLLKISDVTIGIDIVEYLHGQKKKGGSAILREEKNRASVANLARESYMQQHPDPLFVTLIWHGHRPLIRSDLEPLADCAAQIVATHAPTLVNEPIQLGTEQLVDTPLQPFIHSIYMLRLFSGGISSWTSVEMGWLEVTVEELQAVISTKEAKLPTYLYKCASAWLVIVAAGESMASMAELPPETRSFLYRSGFARVFFYSRTDRRVIELRKFQRKTILPK